MDNLENTVSNLSTEVADLSTEVGDLSTEVADLKARVSILEDSSDRTSGKSFSLQSSELPTPGSTSPIVSDNDSPRPNSASMDGLD